MTIELLNIDCMEYMAMQPDKSFDLAIVDTPYSIREGWKKKTFGKEVSNREYMVELKRITKIPMVWVGSYSAYIFDMSRAEGVMEMKEEFIHPTQKPIQIYSWILAKYAKPGQRILDTHLGSGSSAIAAHYFRCDFVGCEIDPDYYQAAKKRFEQETAQLSMF